MSTKIRKNRVSSSHMLAKPKPTLGTIQIKYYSNQGFQLRSINAMGRIGHRFNILPYTSHKGINTYIRYHGIPDIFAFDYSINHIFCYEPYPQTAKIFVKLHSKEVSMAIPIDVLDSLNNYIRGIGPINSNHGPIDAKRSELVRFLISAYGNFSNTLTEKVNSDVWCHCKHNGYITLKTYNPKVIHNGSSRVYRLICGMIRLNIPILQFHHIKHPDKSITLGAVTRVYYTYQKKLRYYSTKQGL